MQKNYVKLIIIFLFLHFLMSGNILCAQQFSETNVRILSEMGGNFGNAVADYDQDGDMDIFIVAYNSFQPDEPKTWSRLLNNRGGWFEDVTIEAGFGNQHSNADGTDVKLGASWGDYDNDGFPDLLLAHQDGTELYRNMGDGTFADVTTESNIVPCQGCSSSSGLWWDYDKDGDLDLYLNYLNVPNRLFNNQGDGTFTEIEGALNLDNPSRTWSSLPIDPNRDGWMDLYVVNDFGLGRFYLNQEGKDFVDLTEVYNLVNNGDGMGSSIGDYNNDGYFDIYITNIAEFIKNPLFMGTESGVFENTQEREQVGDGHFGWGNKFFDADNDGDEDLYIVNGQTDLQYNNVFFKNLRIEGEERFENWSVRSGADGNANGMGAEVFDFDNDGDLDILVSNPGDNPPYLYKNETANPNAWLKVHLEGTASNRSALGAVLKVASEGHFMHRFHHGSTMMGQSLKPVHFGLGKTQKVDSLIISWPSGLEETIYNIAVNQSIKIVEGQNMVEGEVYVANEVPVEEEIAVIAEESSMTIYPNPFTQSITFNMKLEEGEEVDVTIYSMRGLKVYEHQEKAGNPSEWTCNWNGLTNAGVKAQSGMYLYRIQTAGRVWMGKLMLR
ncbi:T9SS type A sorting domain-containing protein [Maribacter algarum]|uniref:T9SS type A sorting domain-containing protein n=1 Tax=Maribacter algarum (ex Zhang et al. 2020) TaxID=2578118 RepID=A0A5S3Q8Z2_9FLAO|nr:CRTAC1 family protein [Maribacter algarum]TMM53381.1 T9SS type A sorting domain-containing protein [Maribacter algarum]